MLIQKAKLRAMATWKRSCRKISVDCEWIFLRKDQEESVPLRGAYGGGKDADFCLFAKRTAQQSPLQSKRALLA